LNWLAGQLAAIAFLQAGSGFGILPALTSIYNEFWYPDTRRPKDQCDLGC